MNILLFCALVVCCLAYQKEVLLKNNIIAATELENVTSSTCDECQSKCDACQFAAKELKVIVGDEDNQETIQYIMDTKCYQFIFQFLNELSKELDTILSDTKKACTDNGYCSSKKHSNMLIYENKCDECQFAVKELKVMVDDEKKRWAVKDFLFDNVCKPLLKRYHIMCDMLLERFSSYLFEELDDILADPKKACAYFGYCTSKELSNKEAGVGGFLSRL